MEKEEILDKISKVILSYQDPTDPDWFWSKERSWRKEIGDILEPIIDDAWKYGELQ